MTARLRYTAGMADTGQYHRLEKWLWHHCLILTSANI